MAYNQIPVEPGAERVRLELGPKTIGKLAARAVKHRLSVSAFVRLGAKLLADNGRATTEEIFAEANRLRPPKPPAAPKRPRGRPRKNLEQNSK